MFVVARLASRHGGLDEAVGERTEERPYGRYGHGDEDDPFFDLAPLEEDSDAIWYWMLVLDRKGHEVVW